MVVLVVEDNPTTGESLCRLIRAKGWTAEWAVNGLAAMAKLHIIGPDVAILDYGLTDVSGREVLAEMLGHVPHVVVFSSEEPERLKELHKEYPYLRILRKPMNPADVLAAMEETMNHKV